MNFNGSESVDEEIQITMDGLRRYEYPEYEEVEEMIENMLELWAEYGEENHECMEAIWNNIFDRDVIETMGEKINKRGGFQAMQATYYTMLHAFRTLHKNNLKDPRVLIAWSRMKFSINVAWDSIGEWRM